MTKGNITGIGATILAAALLGTPASAADKPKPKTTDSVKATAATPMMARTVSADPYKTQLQLYMDAMQFRQAAIDTINAAFSDAVKKAQRDYKAARAAATTAEAKNSADAMRKLAIADANAFRQHAIDDLGPVPQKPVKPTATPTPTTAP